MNGQHKHIYEFGSFQLDPAEHTLLHDGKIVSLTPKVFDTLLILVENNGHLVEKDELLEKVWNDTIVEEANLAKNISILRKVLSQNGLKTPIIETVPKRGYRFVAQVKEISNNNSLLKEKTSRLKVLKYSKSKLSVVAAVLLVALIGFGYWHFAGEKKQIDSIAVMPFVNKSGDEDLEYLSDGITESIINKLARIQSLKVLPPNIVKPLKGKSENPQGIGQKLTVKTVLMGQIIKNGDRLQIQTQLIEVESGKQLWGEKFDRPLTEVMKIEDRIIEKTAFVLGLELQESEKVRLLKKYTQNSEAYQAFLQGTYFAADRKDYGKAEEYFNKAIGLDPDYALAWSGLADIYLLQSQTVEGLDSKEEYLKMRLKAQRAMQKALVLEPNLVKTRLALGWLNFMNWEFKDAEKHFKKAIEIDPDYIAARWRYGYLLRNLRRYEEALSEFRRVERYSVEDPLALGTGRKIADVLFRMGRHNEAMTKIKKIIKTDPENNLSKTKLAEFLSELGKHEEAIKLLKEVMATNEKERNNPFNTSTLAVFYARAGNEPESRQILRKLLKDSKTGAISPFRIAGIYYELGEKERAFEWLEKSYKEKEFLMTFMLLGFENLHSDPRWIDLERRVGFSE